MKKFKIDSNQNAPLSRDVINQAIDANLFLAQNKHTHFVLVFENLKDAILNLKGKSEAGNAGEGWVLLTEDADFDDAEKKAEMLEMIEWL